MTALADRGSAVYRRVSSQLAWGSFVWFAAEPNAIILQEHFLGTAKSLAELLGLPNG